MFSAVAIASPVSSMNNQWPKWNVLFRNAARGHYKPTRRRQAVETGDSLSDIPTLHRQRALHLKRAQQPLSDH